MSLSNLSLASLKSTFDEVKAQYYPKNETEKKVYEALSSKNWGASSTLLNDLAADSMDYDKYKIISSLIWQFLEADGKTWKQIFKTLTLIEFLIKNGSERFIEECRDKMYKIRSFQDYNFYEGNIEKASGVREKSRQIVELLGSNELIRSERDKARQLRNKFVGIDSRNAGYSGGGSGGYYGGGGSSFDNDRGGSSYDRGGRYADSYSDTHNRRASTGSDHHSNTGHGRYGGGAYDSDRPNRYNDDDDRQNFREETREKPQTSRYTDDDFNEEPPAHKPTSTAHRSKSIAGTTSTSTVTGGKLKVTIKKSTDTTHAKPAPVAEKNLLDTGDVDFFSSDAPKSESFDAFTSAPTNNTAAAFDPFGTTPAPAPVNNTATAFDPFGTSAPAPVNHAPVFDPFAAPVPAPVAVAPNSAFPFNAPAPVQGSQFPPVNNFAPNNFGQNNFPPAQPYPSNNSFPPSSIPLAPAPVNNNYGNNQFVQPNPAPVTNNFVQSPPVSNTFSHDAEFGDFEGPAQNNNNSNKAVANNNDKWGDLGKLVDLGKIEKNATLAAKQNPQTNNNNYNNSFAGLDGFSKTPQSMGSTSAVRPIGSYANNTQPMNAMGAPRPMGAPVPSYGAPMGAPMGNPGAAPYGAPMGGAPMYGQVGFGGYPAPGYPPAGAPMGNPGFGAPANPYMGNPNMYNAPPNSNYGNPQYGPPRGW